MREIKFQDVREGQRLLVTFYEDDCGVVRKSTWEGPVTMVKFELFRLGDYNYVYASDKPVKIEVVKDVQLEKGWYLYKEAKEDTWAGAMFVNELGECGHQPTGPWYSIDTFLGTNFVYKKVSDA